MNRNQHTIHFGSEGTKIPPMGQAPSLPETPRGGNFNVSGNLLILIAN